jgi:hypothetical protein
MIATASSTAGGEHVGPAASLDIDNLVEEVSADANRITTLVGARKPNSRADRSTMEADRRPRWAQQHAGNNPPPRGAPAVDEDTLFVLGSGTEPSTTRLAQNWT